VFAARLECTDDLLGCSGVGVGHPKIVAERLGHATVNVTLNVYSHVTSTIQREAAATLDRLLSGA
jgi:integrase